MKKAIIYVRTSPKPEQQAERSKSIPAQIDLCKKFCEQKGYEVSKELIFSDELKSGSDLERDNLWLAIESLKRGDVLVVYKLDRLARGVYESYVIEHAIKKQGATFISSIGEGTWDDKPEDKLLRDILRALDEYIRIAGNARTSAAMKRHMRNGIRMGGKVPYGYIPDPTDKKRMIPNPDEQKVIQFVKNLKSNEPEISAREICRRLTAANFQPRGKKWHHTIIPSMIAAAEIT